MLTVTRGVTGLCPVDLMTTQRTFKSEYFVKQILTPLIKSIREEEICMQYESKFTETIVACTSQK
jgi:hypothetical protein